MTKMPVPKFGGLQLPGKLTRTALMLPKDLTQADWLGIGQSLRDVESGVMWWLGDWLVYGEERKWGEKYSHAVEAGFDYGVARNAKAVAERFHLSRRRDKLPWSHHAVAAGLDPADADRILDEAEREGWSEKELRRQVRQLNSKRFGRLAGPDGAACGFDELHNLVARGITFGTIYADPPWLYDNQATRAATSNHYEGMSVDELCDPANMPIAQLSSANAHLHLWTTNAFLFDAPRIFEAWGFEFKSSFIWTKPTIGTGNYWRNAHEILLTAVRGDAKHFDDHTLKSWLACDRGKHSSKPEQVRTFIEKASPTPRLELFGRQEMPDWLVWGDGIKKTLFDKKVREFA